MQALARLAATEVSRSISTAVVLWAGKVSCPNLSCGEAPLCPDCICHEGRRVIDCPASRCSWGLAVYYIGIGIIIGGALAALLVSAIDSYRPRLRSAAQIAPVADQEVPESSESEDFVLHARAQAKKYGALARKCAPYSV